MASALFSRILFSSRFFHSPRSLFRKPQFSSQIFHTRPFNSRAVEFSQYKLRTHLVCCVILSTNVEAKSYCTRAMSTNEPMVLVEWLHANLREPDIKLPHMLPSEEAFAAAAVSALRIENKDGVVVYDGKGIFSAARVWWMFRVFGHDKVWVLDGGLPRWRASGYDVESSASSDTILKANAASDAIDKVYQDQQVGPITFQTKFQLHLVWTLDQVILTMSKICSDTFLSYTGGVRFFSVKRYAQCSLKWLGRILRTKHSSWLMPAQKPGLTELHLNHARG